MLTKPLVAPLLVAALLLPAGCSDGSSEGTDTPTAPSSSAGSPTASPSSDPSPSEEPSPGGTPGSAEAALPFPDVAPATGRVLRETVVEIRAPKGWRQSAEIAEFASGAHAPEDASLLLNDNDLFSGEGLPEQTIDEQAESQLRAARKEGLEFERQPDVDLGEVTAVRIGGTNDYGLQETRLYAKLPDRTITLNIEASSAILRRDPELFESVINTWTWI